MSSILKVDQIQLADGSTPTASDLGLDIAGSVVQVKYGTSGGPTTTSTIKTWTNVGLSVAITPKYSNSLILILADGVVDSDAATQQSFQTIFRDGVNIGNSPQVYDPLGKFISTTYNSAGRQINNQTVKVYDSPNTTSEVTYDLRIAAWAGTSEWNSQNSRSYITVMEIAQ